MPEPGFTPPAFYGVEQGGLLAADVTARAPPDLDFAGKAGIEDVVAHQAAASCLFQGCFSSFRSEVSLGVDVEVAAGSAGGEGGYQRSLQEAVGQSLHDVPVLEQARLTLLGVDHQDSGTWKVTGPLPLTGRGKVGAAPSLQARFQHAVDDVFR